MISVILCTYNGEKYLQEQLNSIANQTISDWKVCVYDDKSEDQTIQILKRFETLHSGKVEININSQQYGPGQNFLRGGAIQSQNMTDDDYMMFCDQDDIWDLDKMEVSLNEMKKLVSKYGNKEPLLVFGDSRVADEHMKLISNSLMSYNNYNMSHLDLSYELMENKIQGCTVMINSELSRMLQVHPKQVMMHDNWMGLLASSMGHISYLNRPVLMYRRWDASVSGTEDYHKINRDKLGHLSEQKYIVFDCAAMVIEILQLFGTRIPYRNREIMEAFSSLQQQSWSRRRISIIRYHMWKTGIMRNVGLMLLI